MIIRSIERAFAILEFIANNGGMARLRDISQAMNLSKTTTHNLLDTLRKLGYVDQSEDSPRYFITNRLLDLHGPICSIPEIRILVEESIRALARDLNVNSFMAMQSGVFYYYDISSSPDGCPAEGLELGVEQDMYNCVVGKVFIAFSPSLEKSVRKFYPGLINRKFSHELEQIRTDRFAIDFAEYNNQRACIALPLIFRQKVLAVLGCYVECAKYTRSDIDGVILHFVKVIDKIRGEMMR
ncbi:MAG: IclR family transcriptional regulator [Bacteroidales bacterium]